MERNTKTYAGFLQVGDRFYKQSDRKKVAYQVVGYDKVYTDGRLPVTVKCLPDGGNPKYPNEINANTEVIFLRHTTND